MFFGIGGGLVYTAYFAWLYPELSTEEVIVNSMFCIAVNSSASSAKLLFGKPKFRPIYSMLLVIVVISVLSSYWFGVRTLNYPKETFNAVILILMLAMVLKSVFESSQRVSDRKVLGVVQQGTTGVLGGLVAAFSGFGGGVIMVPMMTGIYKIDFKVAKNNSLIAIATLSILLVLSVICGNLVGLSDLDIKWASIVPVSVVSAGVSFFLLSRVEKVNNQKIKWMYLIFMAIFIGSKLFQLFF